MITLKDLQLEGAFRGAAKKLRGEYVGAYCTTIVDLDYITFLIRQAAEADLGPGFGIKCSQGIYGIEFAVIKK